MRRNRLSVCAVSLLLAVVSTQAFSQSTVTQRKAAAKCYAVQDKFFASIAAARRKIASAACTAIASAKTEHDAEVKIDKIGNTIAKTATSLNKADLALVQAVNKIGPQNCDPDYGAWTMGNVSSIESYADTLIDSAFYGLYSCNALGDIK